MTRSRYALLALVLGATSLCYSQQSMAPEHAEGTPSTALNIRAGDRTVTLSLEDLKAMPQTSVKVFNAHNKQEETYSGPLVSEVLARAGVTLSEHTQHSILDTYVTATGTDGYFVVFSGAELQPGLHKTQAIIAVAQSGQPLTRAGAFQLIDSADLKPARWVRNLTSLAIQAASPAR